MKRITVGGCQDCPFCEHAVGSYGSKAYPYCIQTLDHDKEWDVDFPRNILPNWLAYEPYETYPIPDWCPLPITIKHKTGGNP